jgi:outer membrane protein assembly factor BamE (lipoprotein component of BamABCDE complex)
MLPSPPAHLLRISLRRYPRRGLNRQVLLAAAGLAAGLFSGCTSPVVSAPPVEKSAAPTAAGTKVTQFKLDRLKKGMTGSDILAAWGQPEERRPMTTPSGKADIWVYHHVLRSNQRQVATSTHLVTVFDGLTNGTKEIPEAVYSLETIDTVRTTNLLVYQDRLLEWNVSEDNVKKFN